jgi:leader peptidase (prepilin peptidase) / N-methyltransferase
VSSVGVLLAGIDLRSTWLPRRLSQLAWLVAGLALAVSVALGAGWAFAARSLAGAAVAAALYALVWALSRGGIGFGDVRFAPLVGLAAGGLGWSGLLIALTAGSVLGAVHGLARLARGRGAGFPYAPAMLAGGYVALLLDQLMPST